MKMIGGHSERSEEPRIRIQTGFLTPFGMTNFDVYNFSELDNMIPF
jgi:hypothetical protein